MGKKKTRNLLEELAEIKSAAPSALDPDALDNYDLTVASGSAYNEEADSDDEGAPMERSKLRRGVSLASDPKYAGRRVSRRDLDGSTDEDEQESDDDNDAADDYAEDNDGEDADAVSDSDGEGWDGAAAAQLESNSDGDVETVGDATALLNGRDDSSDDDDASDDEATRGSGSRQVDESVVARELAKLEEAEKAAVKEMRADPDADRRKGQHIRAQLAVWDAAVECRIRVQPCLGLANRLPEPQLFESLAPKVSEPLAAASEGCLAVVDHLLKFQRRLALQNPETEGCAVALDDADAPGERASVKRSRPADSDAAWECLESWHSSFAPFLENTVKKWHVKTEAASKRNKRYKSLNQPLMQQVEQTLADKERLRKRTRLMRTPVKFVSMTEMAATKADGAVDYNAEVFDDGDYYQALLRDLIERKASGLDVSDLGSMGRHWAELSKLRTKVKRQVDTRASKGRKLRFEIHEKLVHFMAPDESVHSSTDQARDDLFSSLFQNV